MKKIPCVLVVDDEVVLTEALSYMIKTVLKWEVIVSNSPVEALAILKKNRQWFGFKPNKIDCMIVDIKMPVMTGFEFIKSWRKTERHHHIPAIILSAYEDEKKWVESTQNDLGLVTAYLKKPTKQATLIETLKRIVIRAEGPRMKEELREKSYGRFFDLKQEIEHKIAQDMQKSLLPDTPSNFPGLYVQTLFKPSEYVGGDYYDFFKLSPTKLGVILIDVIGNGIPACFLTMRIREVIHRYMDLQASPKQFMELINNVIANDATFKKGFPTFYGVLDITDKTFTYVNTIGNAGALHITNNQVSFLSSGGFMLGAIPNETYEEDTVKLDLTDRLLLFTDGVTEQSNEAGELFGIDRLMSTCKSFSKESPQSFPEYIYQSVQQFMQTSQQDDDTTIVSIAMQ